jgi:hypothetical protein
VPKLKNDNNARTAYPDLPETEDAKEYYTPFDLAVMLGPHFQVSEKVAIQMLVTPGILKTAKDEVYDVNTGTKEQKFKVNNASLSFTFVYLIHQ